jgi:hypothetical protein
MPVITVIFSLLTGMTGLTRSSMIWRRSRCINHNCGNLSGGMEPPLSDIPEKAIAFDVKSAQKADVRAVTCYRQGPTRDGATAPAVW